MLGMHEIVQKVGVGAGTLRDNLLDDRVASVIDIVRQVSAIATPDTESRAETPQLAHEPARQRSRRRHGVYRRRHTTVSPQQRRIAY